MKPSEGSARSDDRSSVTRIVGGPAVVIAGYLNRVLGLGQAARLLFEASCSAGLDVASLAIELGSSHARLPEGWREARHATGKTRKANIVVVNADQVEHFAAEVGSGFFSGAYNIGVWAWELPTFPDKWADAANRFDEIWVGSSFTQRAVAASIRKPVLTMPLPVRLTPGLSASHNRRHFGISPERFVFLFTFDLYSVFERKNPSGLIHAFERAFGDDDGVELIIKCTNSHADPANMAHLNETAGRARNIRIIDTSLSGDEYASLLQCCDCYVSLHRSEGFGLTMAEAMVAGKPVIATGWSGNLEFMRPDNSFLVSYELRTLARDFGPYEAGSSWAEPDVNHAAHLMDEVRGHPDRAQAVAARGAQTIRDLFSVEEVGRRIASRLLAVVANTTLARQRIASLRRPSQQSDRGTFAGRVLAIDVGRSPLPTGGLKRLAKRLIRRGIYSLVQPQLEQVRAAVLDLHARLQNVEGFVEDAEDAKPLAYRNPDPFYFDSGESLYRSFERVFRGTPALLQTRYPLYMGYLPRDGLILDAGCGTGDLLAWLQQQGLRAEGVDIDPSNVAEARSRDLAVSEGDVVEYLAQRPGTYAGIISVRVVEHLETRRLPAFFAAARDALLPGGVLVAEAVNPYNLSQFRLFWLDPTHRHPIYPELLEFYLRKVGFERIATEFLPCFGEPQCENERDVPWGFCDYLTVATKCTSAQGS